MCPYEPASRSISQLGKCTGLGRWVFAAGRKFAVVCGFSAALGPLLLERALDAVYGRELFPTVTSLPLVHVIYMFRVYWQNEVSPFDASGRFFRMVANPETGTITKLQFSSI